MKEKKVIPNTESYGTKDEYHDGGKYWHWGGNDDYKATQESEEDFTGKVAYGNLDSNSSSQHLSQSEKEKAA